MKTRTVFFIGSGISIPPPSAAPGAAALVEEIIRAASPNSSVARRLLTTCSQRHGKLPAGSQLVRFEQFIEAIQETADPDLEALDIFKTVRTPNAMHFALARRAIVGDTLITTNFDCLLEEAVIHLGGKPRSICSEQDFDKHRSRNEAGVVPIFKLHGSVERFRPGRPAVSAAYTLGATIKSITRNAVDPLPPPGKLSFLLRTLRGAHVTVLGYSGSDDFDIIPALRMVKPRTVVWVEHDPKRRWERNDTSALKRRLRRHRWTSLTDRDRLFEHWLRSRISFSYVRAFTAAFVAARIGVVTVGPPKGITPASSLRSYFRTWCRNRNVTRADSFLIAGELLFRACQYRHACTCFRHALRRSGNPRKAAEIRLYLARALVDCGQHVAALRVLRCLGSSAKRGLTPPNRLRLAHARAFIAYKLRRFAEALRRYRMAGRMARSQRNVEFLGTILHDMGVVLQERGEFLLAASNFRAALPHSRRAGNARHVNWSQYHLGIVSYYQANLAAARNSMEASIATAKRLGDLNQCNNSEHALALIDFLAGRLGRAERGCESCLQLAKETGQAEWSGMDWQHLGICAMERRQWVLATKYFKRAEACYTRVQDEDTLAELYAYWSLLMLARRQPRWARYRVQRAVAFAVKRRLPEFLSRAVFTEGVIETLDGSPTLGRKKMKRGLAIGRSVPVVLLELLYDGARSNAFLRAQLTPKRSLEWAESVYASVGNRFRARVVARTLRRLLR